MNFGCSSFSWTTEDGCHLLGRTYDQLGDLRANRVVGVPQGVPCAPGLRADSGAPPGLYSYTGMAVLGFGEPILVDGVNSAGLMGALLHYPGYASYPAALRPGTTAVHPGRLLAWLLSRCAGVQEAAEAMNHLTLTDEPVLGKPLAAHYLLSDRSGEAIVLEPDQEGLQIHRQTIGVLTNSPPAISGTGPICGPMWASPTCPKLPRPSPATRSAHSANGWAAALACREITPPPPASCGWPS